MNQKHLDKDLILQIVSRQDWEEAQQKGVYKTASLTAKGFIHCSKVSQVLGVANYLFKGQEGLVLLCIDPEKLIPELRVEALGLPETYPHIYGELNLEAVIKVIDFPPEPDGLFQLPENLS